MIIVYVPSRAILLRKNDISHKDLSFSFDTQFFEITNSGEKSGLPLEVFFYKKNYRISIVHLVQLHIDI